VCAYVRAHVCVCVCERESVREKKRVCLDTCVNLYMYIYIYIYGCVYTYGEHWAKRCGASLPVQVALSLLPVCAYICVCLCA